MVVLDELTKEAMKKLTGEAIAERVKRESKILDGCEDK